MEQINKVLNTFKEEINILTLNASNLEVLKNKYLSKKGLLAHLTDILKTLPPEEKPLFGQALNKAKNQIITTLNELSMQLAKVLNRTKLLNEKLPLSLPGEKIALGFIHPLTIIEDKIKSYFIKEGYQVVYGPEVEDDWHNFTLMNIPPNHPARAMHDSLYFNANSLLRTHTSPVQAREMLNHPGKPLKIISPGKVYRRDAEDSKHSHQFNQIEGLVLAPGINFGNLKATLLGLLRYLFGEEINIRMRPSYFPFTEPSIEIDLLIMQKDNTPTFTEILGAGMVHPDVLKGCGYNPAKIQGFAFGIGIERVAMKYFGIDDIRLFYQNDIRFLQQFKEDL